MTVSKQITFESHVPTVQAAFAFIMEYIDQVGETPSFAAQHSFMQRDGEEDWTEGFTVVVSGQTEIETPVKTDDFLTLD